MTIKKARQYGSLFNSRYSNVRPLNSWLRNPSWLAMPSVTTSEQKFVGLFAVYPDASGGEASNFLAFTMAGNYTVNWGDGVTENFNTGVTAQHIYDFNDADLANTNAPVTLTDSGDKIERTAHGYANGMTVQFYNIVSTTGITEGQTYYVINANANDFQISTTQNGSAVSLTTNGSATLLNYKQAIVTVTPQSGQNLTSINLNVKHNQSGLQTYENGWLDVRLGSPNLSSLTIGSVASNSGMRNIQLVELVNTGTVTSFSNIFRNLTKLQKVIIGTIGNITNTSQMFQDCHSLVSAPLFNTASVTNMSSMFSVCRSLVSVPLFNTASVTNMSSMFSNCSSLVSVPLFNTASVTNMSNMFNGCSSLASVPLFNTASVTNMNSMFTSCSSLTSVPLFNTASASIMTQMFSSCSSLTSVPLFNTVSVTSMSSMFNNCPALVSVPLFNMNNVINVSQMFQTCSSLTSVPAYNLSAVNSSANFLSMYSSCASISDISASGARYTHSIGLLKLSKTALKKYMDNIGVIAIGGQTLTISSNWGIGTSGIKTVTSTAQSTTVTCADTTGLLSGMMMTGSGTGLTTGIDVISDVAADTLSFASHGLVSGTKVAFTSSGTTGGIGLNTIYYPININPNDFQISTTSNGSAINLTGSNSAMNLRYGSYITAINPNVSVTLDTPAASGITNGTWTFRQVDAYGALLRGWAVTY